MADNDVVAGSGRLTDWVSLGVLASFVPRDAVDEAVAGAGRGARRAGGKLPPHVVVYLVMALALFAEVISSLSPAVFNVWHGLFVALGWRAGRGYLLLCP